MPLASAKGEGCRLKFLCPRAFRVQILLFTPSAWLFLPRTETFSITVVFGTCRNSNNSLGPIKGHHYLS